MSVKKYILGMRPKKYLTRDFVVYRDPSSMSLEASDERQDFSRGGRGYVKIEDQKIKGRMSREELIKFIKTNKNLTNIEKVEKLNKAGKLTQRAKPFTKENLQQFINQEKLGEFSPIARQVLGRADSLQAARDILDKLPKGSKVFQGDIVKQTGVNRSTLTKIIKNEYPGLKTVGREEFIQQRTKKGYETGQYSTETASQRAVKINKQRRKIINDISNYQFEDKIRKFKSGQPIDQAHRLSIKYAQKQNQLYNINNLGFDDPKTNQETIKVFENQLTKEYAKQKKLVDQAKKFKTVPESIRKELSKVNSNISDIISKTGNRLQGIHIDENTLQPKVTGIDYAKTVSFGVVDKPVKEMTDVDFGIVKKNIEDNINIIKQTNKQDLTTLIATLADGCRVNYADGGRIGYSTGSDCFNRGLEVLKKATQGDQTGLQKVKTNLKQFGKAGGKLLRLLELPIELAAEGLLIGYDMAFNRKPYSEAVKDSGLVLRFVTSDFKTSGEEDRANAIAQANPDAARYVEAKNALDKYNKLKGRVDTLKDDLASADIYEDAVKQFTDYEKKIEDKLPQYKSILTPGSPEYEAFKTDRTALARERVDEAYDQAELVAKTDPIESSFSTEDEMKKAREDKFKTNVNEIGSAYDWKPTLDEYKKNTIPKIYEATGKVLGENAEFDAFIEDFVGKQYNKDLDLFTRPGFAGGGLTRRGFLKFIGGLTAAAAAIKSGIVKLTTPAAKQVLKNAPTGTPDWFAPLVEKILKEGVEVPNANVKTVTGREKVTKLEMPSEGAEGALTDKYYVFENPDTGEIRIDIDVPGVGANDGEFSLYLRPDRIEGINDDGTPMLSEGEFFVTEDRAVGRMSGPDDYDIDLEPFDTDLSGSASDFYKIEEFATGKTNKKAQSEQLKKKDYIERNPGDDIESRYGPYDDTIPDDDY
tara:strand:+ start:1230 stop:4013 length:2784 start_codon:yes stop_codon:yes gene_type:complete